MANLEKLFKNNKVFIPYITAGDPDLNTTEELVYSLEKAGADAIELGIPFSDPIADGPVIQKAHIRALNSGTTLIRIMDLVSKIRQKSTVPLLFMMSYNSIIQYGEDNFVADIAAIQLSGVIVPDMPFEESGNLQQKLNKVNIPFISFVAPTTSHARIKKIASKAKGFIYLISSTGVTGARQSIQTKLQELVSTIKNHTNTPVAIGFGISNAEMAAEMSKIADGIIVGSAIVKIIEDNGTASAESVTEFAKGIKQAITRGANT